MQEPIGFGNGTGLSPTSILNAMSPSLGAASNQLSALLDDNFDPTNPNSITLLQIYTENLNALLTATSNAMKSVFDDARAVLQNIS